MVIDKTTGKGCAWSIVAKTVTQNLIADGIVGKIIAKKNRYKRDVWLQIIDCGDDWVCITWDFVHGLAEEPLWVPSFIDEGIWKQAASKFPVSGRLDDIIAEVLLPEMDKYLQSIPVSELISMTRDFLIKNGVLNQPIQQHKGKTYYFNDDEVYSLDETGLFPYEGRIKFNIFKITGTETAFFNNSVWLKAASQFKIGMTLKECIEIFLKTELTCQPPQEITPIDRLVQYVAPPVYERVPGNKNEATFDRVRVTVGLPRYQFSSWEALQNEVKKYRHEIYQQVIQQLEKDRQFKKYGVPINFLKISNATLLRDFSLEFIFELKEQGIIEEGKV